MTGKSYRDSAWPTFENIVEEFERKGVKRSVVEAVTRKHLGDDYFEREAAGFDPLRSDPAGLKCYEELLEIAKHTNHERTPGLPIAEGRKVTWNGKINLTADMVAGGGQKALSRVSAVNPQAVSEQGGPTSSAICTPRAGVARPTTERALSREESMAMIRRAVDRAVHPAILRPDFPRAGRGKESLA